MRVMSTTVEGSPLSSPPSIARSTRFEDLGRDVRESGRRRLAAEVGRGLEERAHGAGQRAGDQADAEALGVLAAGERVAVLGVGDDQGHRAREQGADRARAVRGPRPATSSRIASGEKYMTAEGLPSSRPLIRWMRAIAAASSGSQASP